MAYDRMSLGPLEMAIMELLWDRGKQTACEIMQRVDRDPAYTTVMTTLDRLLMKGLLNRRTATRPFFYSARMNRSELTRMRVRGFISGFIAQRPEESVDVLLSAMIRATPKRNGLRLLVSMERQVQAVRSRQR
jgi:predicted transcriptional regulator